MRAGVAAANKPGKSAAGESRHTTQSVVTRDAEHDAMDGTGPHDGPVGGESQDMAPDESCEGQIDDSAPHAVIDLDESCEDHAATSSDYYFHSYSHFAIHEEMIKDTHRTETYRNAILMNRAMFNGKIVLDVGCGTGILSLFAAQAGAAHVYGVDMSSVAEQAKSIVKLNGYEDRVTILRGKMEDLELPVPAVDVIISEWYVGRKDMALRGQSYGACAGFMLLRVVAPWERNGCVVMWVCLCVSLQGSSCG